MANTTISPNMQLVIPTVSLDPGPDWANNINSSLAIIDQHNHTSGQGVQITPAGLNINSDLPFGGNNATLLRTIRFSPQTSVPGGASDIGCLSVSGVDLYYNDVNGNQIRITQSGSVSGSSGTITGLPSGTASASYNNTSGTFVFQSATNKPANLDGASLVLRNFSANSHGLTLSPPSAMASDYTITMPFPPSSTSFTTMDSGGNFGASVAYPLTNSGIASNTILQTNLSIRALGTTTASVGQIGIAGMPSLDQTVSSTTPVDVAGLSITITTRGNPVMIMIQGDESLGVASYIQFEDNNPSSVDGGNVIIVNGSTDINISNFGWGTAPEIPVLVNYGCSISFLDTSVAGNPGTYTYKVQMVTQNSVTMSMTMQAAKLVVYEI